MTTRTIAAMICSVFLSSAAACTKQPAAPSIVEPAASSTAAAASTSAAVSPSRLGSRTPGVVFVTSQGLYYDTFVVKDPLPMHGPFQRLSNGQTEFGPGQPGYLGGRWWEDVNQNGLQDPDDHYFLCPLLPPGRPTP